MLDKNFWQVAAYVLRNRNNYKPKTLIQGIARSTKIILYYREHKLLLELTLYRKYLIPLSHKYVFRHLTHRLYLMKGLRSRDRVECVVSHYKFEDKTFDEKYKQHVYKGEGLLLWRREIDGNRFDLILAIASPGIAEGELTVSLYANGARIHYLGFSWLNGSMVELPSPTVLFISCNQGQKLASREPLEAFKNAFPKNSPRFFCFCAVQGIASALGMNHVVGIKAERQVSFRSNAKNFSAAYDAFWKDIGGNDLQSYGFLIPIPFYRESGANTTSKYGRQAVMRRLHWDDVSSTVCHSIQRSMQPLSNTCFSKNKEVDKPNFRLWPAVVTAAAGMGLLYSVLYD